MESWLDMDDCCPGMNGYVNFRSDRKKKRKSKRSSGGFLIYCRSSLVNGVSKISSFSDDILWLKLDRFFFGLPNDVYMCIAYLVPESSPYAQDIDLLQELTNEVDYYSTLGSIAIIGDLNSRIETGKSISYWHRWEGIWRFLNLAVCHGAWAVIVILTHVAIGYYNFLLTMACW